MKNIIFGIIILIVVGNSCKKPKGDEECTWEREIINMHIGVCKMQTTTSYEDVYGTCIGLDSIDSCRYDFIKIGISFDFTYLSQNNCSSPKDSIVGKIDEIIVVCENNYNSSYLSDDTINDILNVIYTKPNGMIITTPVSLLDYLQNDPICSNGIKLFLTQPPGALSLQSFKIIYKETDGTIFSITTKPIYVIP